MAPRGSPGTFALRFIAQECQRFRTVEEVVGYLYYDLGLVLHS
jgi:hypothetical protein